MNRIQAVNNEKEAVANADEAERQRKKAVDNERIAKEQEREAKESANAERQAKEGEKHQRQLAEERAAIGLSRQLAAQAVQHLDEQERSLSLLLSLEAYRSGNTTEARRSLIAGLEYNPYLITFLSSQNKEFHSKQIAAVAFSPNGRILAAGSMNRRNHTLGCRKPQAA